MSSPSFQEGVRNKNREAFIAKLHEEAPIYRDAAGFWVVSRFADAREVLLDHERFSSWEMGAGVEGAAVPAFRLPLLTDDPPRHSHLRKLVSKAFTPGRIEQMRPEVTVLARDLVQGIEPGAEVDIVQALTMPLPVTVIARMLGVPESDRERFKSWSNAVTGLGVGIGAERNAAVMELRDYFLGVLAERRASPGSDLVSALARAEEEGVPLSDDEIAGFAILLLVAGNETTTNLLGSLLHRLAAKPEAWTELRATPALLRPTIEEALRLDSPAQIVMRRARQDTQVGGRDVAKGDMVFVYLGAVNRDPSRWSSPGNFAAGAQREGHMAFGFGVHTCIGAPLARLEAELGMAALLDRFEHIAFGQERPHRLPSGVLFGFRSLHVVFS